MQTKEQKKKSAYHKKWRDKNKEKEKLRTRKWQKENPTRVLQQQRNWAFSTGRKWKEAGIKNTKNEFFGQKDYEELFNLQQGKCALCRTEGNANKKRLCVDHNHKTGRARKLLCFKCNFRLGFIEKETFEEFYKKAKEYILKF